MVAAQFLPTIHPLLPKIRITEQSRPPFTAKERPRAPTARLRVTFVDRTQRAIEIPVRAADNFSITRLVEIRAEDHRIHVPAEQFEHVKVNRGIHINVGAITLMWISPFW